MSVYDDKPRAVDPRELDLLVDGELSDERRRGLLNRLDETPGGWRRCALAFLEAQSWRESLGSLGNEVTAEPIQPPRPSPPSAARKPRGWTTVLAVAASLLIALGIGLVAGDLIRGNPPGGGEFAETDRGSTTAPQRPGQPAPGPRDGGVAPGALPGPWRMVQVTMPGEHGGPSQRVRVPCLESDRYDEALLRGQPFSVPPELVEALQDPHVRVRQYRQLVPMRTRDGRQVVFPWDGYQVQYVDNPAY